MINADLSLVTSRKPRQVRTSFGLFFPLQCALTGHSLISDLAFCAGIRSMQVTHYGKGSRFVANPKYAVRVRKYVDPTENLNLRVMIQMVVQPEWLKLALLLNTKDVDGIMA